MGFCKIVVGFFLAIISAITFTLLPLLLPHVTLYYVHASPRTRTLDARINDTLCPSASPQGRSDGICAFDFVPPEIPPRQYIRRDDITDSIIRVVTGYGDHFAAIEGPNRVGKSTAVNIAVSELSRTRLVRKVVCLNVHGVVEVLAELLLADLHDLDWQTNLPTSHRPLVVMPTYEELHEAMLRRPRQTPEPVFVIEAAELLAVPVLLTLLSFGTCCQWDSCNTSLS